MACTFPGINLTPTALKLRGLADQISLELARLDEASEKDLPGLVTIRETYVSTLAAIDAKIINT